jgi:hypothetical protein
MRVYDPTVSVDKQGRQVVLPLPRERCLNFVGSVNKEGNSWPDWVRIASRYIEENEVLNSVELGPGGVQLSFTKGK